jgi:hypothetical protein
MQSEDVSTSWTLLLLEQPAAANAQHDSGLNGRRMCSYTAVE